MNNTRLLWLQAGIALVALTGCATTPAPKPLALPMSGERGVVIASSKLVPGVTQAGTVMGTTSDCSGPGLGVVVEGVTGGTNQLFDSNAQPCEAATTLFDGRTKLGQRAADPAITITFQDHLGPRSDRPAEGSDSALAPIPDIRLTTQNIAPAAGELTAVTHLPSSPATPQKPALDDSLVTTLSSWQGTENAQTEAARLVDAVVSKQRTAAEESRVAELLAELREKERRLEAEQNRRTALLQTSETKRRQTEATLNTWQAEQAAVKAELEATQTRLKEYEELNARLAADKAAKESAYQARVQTLSSDLKVAERQAQRNQQELVLAAAAKIAEAEQLAHAARVQEQELKIREAARLKQEAEQMMARALDINASKPIMAANIEPAAAPLPLVDVPVVLHAKDTPLPALVDEILTLAKAQAGGWKADWQLSGKAQYILKEKWSLTAEATVAELLQQLTDQVKATHGITLTFTQFQQSRLLVVTDE